MRATTGLLAIALAIADLTSAQNSTKNATEALVANQEQFWSYGRSPPVYPSRMLVRTACSTHLPCTNKID